ncbi:hypothetical protein BS47DRAFT_1345896 [Hydnum rufescens UP504]|uniref:Transcription initiation factor TFIID subunit 4 n=1 Tax=Hydnum rufescens UP504 TaxID=1448309 RepID=A0A9P6AUT1_9AGAM|nr:hypothetical protein BS47DRAFT_1345896 [Hydnum rufescens UP504]
MSQGTRTATPSAAKRSRTDPPTLVLPSGGSPAMNTGLALPTTNSPLPSNTASKPYGSPSTGGLALPGQWPQPQIITASIRPSYSNPQQYIPAQQRPPYYTQYYPTPPTSQYPYPPQSYGYYPTPQQYQAQSSYPRPPLQHAQSYTSYAQSRVQTPTSVTPTSTPAPAPPVPPQPDPHDSADPNEINDALGSSGVDLKAEQEALQRSHEFYQPLANLIMRDDRSKKQAFIHPRILSPTMRSIASKHNVTKVSDDSINYAALALRERLLGLITSSIHARDHRSSSGVNRPPGMYSDNTTPLWSHVVRRDTTRQLQALEKVDREEETRIRRERRERLENGFVATPDGGRKKRKRAKEMGPGVTARTMSDEARKKLQDDQAARATGSKKYAWMTAGAGSSISTGTTVTTTGGSAGAGTSGLASTTARKPSAPVTNGTATTTGTSATGATTTPGTTAPAFPAKAPTGGGWMRAPMPQTQAVGVGGRSERGHGGGRGSARGWT